LAGAKTGSIGNNRWSRQLDAIAACTIFQAAHVPAGEVRRAERLARKKRNRSCARSKRNAAKTDIRVTVRAELNEKYARAVKITDAQLGVLTSRATLFHGYGALPSYQAKSRYFAVAKLNI
jgi:hypothetical protein